MSLHSGVNFPASTRHIGRTTFQPVHDGDRIASMKESFQRCFNRDWKNILLSCYCSGRRDLATVLLLLIAAHIGHSDVAEGYGAEVEAPEACGVGLVEDTMLVRTKLARGSMLILGGRRRGDG
ncbi:hypothetical protein Peur_001448 [Populus x canadensis]